MIILLNSQPVSEKVKILKAVEKAKALYGSDFFDLETNYWFGDNLTIESLFPNWILKEYEENQNNVLVIPIIKNYLRWLFSIDYGYGAQLDWENIRVPLKMNSIFLEALAEFYFPGANFSEEPLKAILPNIRRFASNIELDYNYSKGTPKAIKYLICNLFGFGISEIDVYTTNSGIIQIDVLSSKMTTLNLYNSFLQEYVFPIGTRIIYGTK
jgi:hypothetical protein